VFNLNVDLEESIDGGRNVSNSVAFSCPSQSGAQYDLRLEERLELFNDLTSTLTIDDSSIYW
jgi:hypothetical protein